MQPSLQTVFVTNIPAPFISFHSRFAHRRSSLSGRVAVVLVGSLGGVGQLLESLSNDANTLAQLLLGDDHGGSKADNVAVSGLGLQQAD